MPNPRPARRKPATSPSSSVSVVDGPSREFRKTNEAIGLRLREGRLSLLTRKLFNVMILQAQTSRDLGVNAPIDTPAAKKYFWMPLSDLARDAAYNSKDMDFLKRQLDELQGVRLLFEDHRRWTSELLLSSVTFVNPKGLHNKHAGQVWFGFAFPPEVYELVMSPSTYTRFSVLYQNLLRSGASLALYEICRRYLGSPGGVTKAEEYPYWYGYLSGNPIPDDLSKLTPYKYFKRDTLRPAIAEINAITDIEIELIEHPVGRRVGKLQFAVRQTKQPQLEFPVPPVIDTKLQERVSGFGFTQQDVQDMVALHGTQRLEEVAAIVEARIEAKSSPPLDSPAAYFRWALRQGVTPRPQGKLRTRARKTAQEHSPGQSLIEAFLSARAAEALALYREMSPNERAPIVERFRAGASPRIAKGLSADDDMERPIVRVAFSRWYAHDLWGEPTTQALAEFVERYGAAALAGAKASEGD